MDEIDIIEAIQERIDDRTRELASGSISLEDYRYVVGRIRGMRDSIDIVKEMFEKNDW